MKKILFITIGAAPFVPTEIPLYEKYKLLSNSFYGEIISIIFKKEFRRYNLENFILRGLYIPPILRRNKIIVYILFTLYALAVSLYSHYFRNRYHVIVATNPGMAGFVSHIIKKLTGIKIVIEVNGNFDKALVLHSLKTTTLENIKQKYGNVFFKKMVSYSDGIKFVDKSQLSSFKLLNFSRQKVFIFPNFVSIRHFKPDNCASNYILFLGYPWFLKGVDILIRAFNKINKDFPDYTLKIVGYCPDKSEFVKLAAGNDQIEFCDPVWYEEVVKLISGCCLFVLPSRSDASPRVLREAMASKKPIIASNIDGIPFLLNQGKNGLLFEPENVDDLSEKMRKLLNDNNFAGMLAENGYNYVHKNLSEKNYLNNFKKMIEKIAR